ncbi:MAG: TonB-dependent receptor [Pseudomonadota bacterium]
MISALHAQAVFAEQAGSGKSNFNIPQQRADRALTAFAEQADLTLMFPYELARNERANETVGRYTVAEAITRLLAGTRLDPVFDRAGRLKIVPRSNEVEEKVMTADRRTGLAALLSGIFIAPMGYAQEVAVDGAKIEEIVVTAQIREESFQEIPVTGSVFDAQTLDDNRLELLDDVARFTPGLVVSYFNNSSPNFAIRGAMNTFSQAGASKPVGIFVDDVFIPRNSAAAFELFDIHQVSVLRGPQGTLFGRNVTAGAVQIYTSEPDLEDTALKLRAGIGSDSFSELSALLSAPLAENVAGKLSLGYKQRDGFSVDRFSGQEFEDLDSLTARASLLFVPSDRLEIKLSADFSRDENGGKGYSFISSSDASDFTGNDGNPRTSELRVPQDYERDIAGVSAHFDWTPGAGRFQSITAYRQSESRELYSLGAADVTLPSVSTQFIKDDQDDPKSFSQELRYISDKGDRFDFIAGLYLYREDTDRFLGDELLGAGGNAVFVDREFTVDAETTSVAAYLSATFHLGDKFDLGIGGRYTREDKDVGVSFVDNNNGGNSFVTNPSSDFSEFTPRVTLTYHATDNLTLFASRSEGFTAGGFNTETNNIVSVELGFDPETVTAYELGTKSSWFDGGLVVNATLFSQDYEDKQEGFLLPGSFFSIFNASQATMEGLELEAAWALNDRFAARLSYSYLDASYDQFVIPGGADFSGNRLQQAPENSYSLALDYVQDFGMSTLSGGLSVTYQDDYFTGASNIPQFRIDSYSLVNARLGWAWGGGRWSVQAWGKNLGDEDFVRIRGTSGAIAEYYGPPRTYGVNLTYESN